MDYAISHLTQLLRVCICFLIGKNTEKEFLRLVKICLKVVSFVHPHPKVWSFGRAAHAPTSCTIFRASIYSLLPPQLVLAWWIDKATLVYMWSHICVAVFFVLQRKCKAIVKSKAYVLQMKTDIVCIVVKDQELPFLIWYTREYSKSLQ